jgi:hypothetical protein
MEFKRYVKISSGIVLIFPIVLLILAGIVWSQNVYTGIIYLVVGIIQLVGMVIIYPRIRKLEDVTEIGNKYVQHNWVVLSFAVTGCAVFLAPFFTQGVATAIPYIAFAVCVVSAGLSIFNLYKAVKEAKARLVV